MAARVAPNAVATSLAQSLVFRGCAPAMLSQLAPHVEQSSFAARDVIAAPGTTAGGLGLLHSGRATMRLAAGAGPGTPLDELQAGDCFGEVSLLLGGHNPYAVVADEECVVLTIRKDHFEQILAAVPSVAQALAKRLASRFMKAGVLGARAAGAPVAAAAAVDPTPSGMMRAANAPNPPSGDTRKNDVRFVEVASYQIPPQTLELIPARLIQQHRLFPLELRGRTLVVGMVNPFALESRQELRRFLHNVDPEIVAISADDWAQACVRHKVQLGADKAAASAGGAVSSRFTYQAEQRKEQEKQQIIIGDEVVGQLDRIFNEALERGASDIHVEPDVAHVRVRFRVQGMIIDRKEVIPASFALPLIARVKVLAELDITERRLPQDGRIVAFQGRRELNFRVSTLPTARGEKAVIRVLDAAEVMRPFNQIFLDGQAADLVYQAISGGHGAVLVAGPSASGKSTTLYSLLNQRRLLRPDNNIVTVEDPVEYPFPGLTQVSVNPRAGLDYAAVLRSLLRQDPDVLVVGELREPASAGLALEAALTGHVVMATLHGSSVVAVLQRLEQYGLHATLLSQGLNAIIVQRLARRLCASCAREEEVGPALLDNLVARGLAPRGGGLKLPRAVGCDLCDKTGFLGRVAVVELLSLQDEQLRVALASGTSPAEILTRAAGTNHYIPIVRSAKLLMARKVLSPADALLAVSA
jgi:type IV pilus assembly protein PilB